MAEQLLLKSPPEEQYLSALEKCKTPFMYMPIVRNYEQFVMLRDWRKRVNIVGYELIFDTLAHPLVSEATRREIDDAIIEEVLINGTANLADEDLKIIRATATEYVNEIFRRLREHGYDDKSTTLYVTGGGGCLVKNFYHYDKSRVFFVDDICAAAKGYEHMAELQLGTGAGI